MSKFLAFLTLVVGLMAFGSAASAQEDSGGDGANAVAETTVGGTLKTKDETGETVFVEGVNFIVTDADGVEVGIGTTDADGVWSVALPASGAYSTLLDISTLPDGIDLRNPDSNPIAFTVIEGNNKSNLFPLGERASTATSTIKAVQLAVDGVKLGLIIGMCAIGLSLIYGTTGLTNFSHGEIVTFGAMLAFLFNVTGVFGWRTNLIVAGIFSVVICGVAGGLFDKFVWRPLRNRGASLISALVVSLGFSILFRYMMLFQFGGRVQRYRSYQLQSAIDFKFFSMVPKDIFIVLFSILVLVGVGFGLQKTRAGKAMRAVADNRDLAESSGIDVDQVIRLVWVLGAALAGLGGVLFGLTETIGWEMGFRLLLLMFAGVTLGGLGTAYGALLGSLIVGIFIQMSTLIPGVTPDLKNVGALLTLIIILLVRPQGLLGRAERVG